MQLSKLYADTIEILGSLREHMKINNERLTSLSNSVNYLNQALQAQNLQLRAWQELARQNRG